MTEPGEPREQRERLVGQLRDGGVLHDERVTAAMRAVPRHLFLPAAKPERAYADIAVVTKTAPDGRPISSASQPAIVAIMLEQLGVLPGHRVLEVGAGTGYNAALLARLAGPDGQVTTVDVDTDIVEAAREHLASAGVTSTEAGPVQVVTGDGGLGWPPGAPYDRIVATVGAGDIPPAWWQQLRPDGRLLLPLALRPGLQYSVAFAPEAGHLASLSVVACGFMPLRGAFAAPDAVIEDGRDSLRAETGPRPPGADALATLLDQRGEPVSTGVVLTLRELWGGLGAWLAAHEPDLGRLSTLGEAPPSGRAADLIVGSIGALLLAGQHGCAVLTRPREPDGQDPADRRALFELGVTPFGPEGPELADRLARRAQDWAVAGRPGVDRLVVRAWPAGTGPEPAAGETSVDLVHTRLLLSWRPAP